MADGDARRRSRRFGGYLSGSFGNYDEPTRPRMRTTACECVGNISGRRAAGRAVMATAS